MSNSKVLRQVRAIVLLPLTIFLWIIGWALYCVGDQRMASRTAQQESVTVREREYERQDVKEVAAQHSS